MVILSGTPGAPTFKERSEKLQSAVPAYHVAAPVAASSVAVAESSRAIERARAQQHTEEQQRRTAAFETESRLASEANRFSKGKGSMDAWLAGRRPMDVDPVTSKQLRDNADAVAPRLPDEYDDDGNLVFVGLGPANEPLSQRPVRGIDYF